MGKGLLYTPMRLWVKTYKSLRVKDWGSQEGCQGPSRPSGRNRGLPLSPGRGRACAAVVRLRGMPRGWAGELLVDSHVAAVSRRAR